MLSVTPAFRQRPPLQPHLAALVATPPPLPTASGHAGLLPSFQHTSRPPSGACLPWEQAWFAPCRFHQGLLSCHSISMAFCEHQKTTSPQPQHTVFSAPALMCRQASSIFTYVLSSRMVFSDQSLNSARFVATSVSLPATAPGLQPVRKKHSPSDSSWRGHTSTEKTEACLSSYLRRQQPSDFVRGVVSERFIEASQKPVAIVAWFAPKALPATAAHRHWLSCGLARGASPARSASHTRPFLLLVLCIFPRRSVLVWHTRVFCALDRALGPSS